MNMSKIYTFTVIVLLLSCSGSHKESRIHPAYEPSMKLERAVLVSFPIADMGFIHGSIGYNEFDSIGYLSILNSQENEINVYDYDKNRIIEKIKLKQEGPDGVGALDRQSSHFMISKDSIFVFHLAYGQAFLLNGSSEVLRKYTLIDFRNDSYSAVPIPSTLNPIIKVGNDILLSCTINAPQLNYETYQTVLKLNLETGEQNFIFSLPRVYSDRFWALSFKYQVCLAFNHLKNELMLNYPVIHDLYIGSLEGEIIDTKFAGSQYIDRINAVGDDLSVGTTTPTHEAYREMANVDFSSSDYISLLYDEHRKVYYRIVHIRPKLEDVENGDRIPELSIILLDDELNKLGETRLSKKRYNHSMFFVSDRGLNIARKDLYLTNEDSISFEVFIPTLIDSLQ